MDYKYSDAVQLIKTAILHSQYESAKYANEQQLRLYYGIGKYISFNSRNKFWGQGAIDSISEQLSRELPGLRGFSPRNLRNMRIFYEEWSLFDTSSDGSKEYLESSASASIKSDTEIWQKLLPNLSSITNGNFFAISFSSHLLIISKVKDLDERIFYINRCACEKYSLSQLKRSLLEQDYSHQGNLPNNFKKALSPSVEAFRAINTFKDEYLLDYINVEEIDIRDVADIDERVVENSIVNNIKKFILTFGKDFAFVGNQYHIEHLGESQYIDLLFFNRALNCLVAVELKQGKFKTSYLGQLQGYLSILDGFEKKPHENPSIGIILCKDMNKSFVNYVIQDYSKPIGVATYKTSNDMSDDLRNALPNIEDLKRLLDNECT